MKLETLSPTAIKRYLDCPAKYRAHYIDGVRNESGHAANLGTACHEALEIMLRKPRPIWSLSELLGDYQGVVATYLEVPFWENEGYALLQQWWERQDWDLWNQREILSIEEKQSFNLATSVGIIPFRYIIDRLDRNEDGELEVVDYKTGWFQLWPDDLRKDIQARSYALATYLNYDKPDRVWVTFDYLRSDQMPASIAFTADELEKHFDWLHEIAETIIADEGFTETPNSLCRYCPRSLECRTLWNLTLTDLHGLSLEQLAVLKIHVAAALGALENSKARIDTSLREALEEAEQDELVLESGTVVTMTMGRRERTVNWERACEILEIPYVPARLTLKDFEWFIDTSVGSEAKKEELRQCIEHRRKAPSLKVIKSTETK